MKNILIVLLLILVGCEKECIIEENTIIVEDKSTLSNRCQRFVDNDYPESEFNRVDQGCFSWITEDSKGEKVKEFVDCRSLYEFQYMMDSIRCNAILIGKASEWSRGITCKC